MPSIETADSQRADRRLFKHAMKMALLEPERERALAFAWREHKDEAALHELTTAYMRLVIAMASRFKAYGLPMGDLVQEGCVGLMQAAARFEPEREVRFSTYATWWIRASIQDYVLRNWSIVRTGTTAAQKALFFNLRRLRALIADGGQPQLSPEGRAAIAKKLDVNVHDVEMMEARLSAADRSLNAPVGEEGDAEWQDLLVDDHQDPEADAIASEDRRRHSELLGVAMERLNPRELAVIKERRLGTETVTLESLGRRMGISKERVRQIEHQALRKLRRALVDQVGDPVAAGLTDERALLKDL
ncbi:MAG: RNA polymerase factor sigma-32 [Alphaproteobacteria bacterium]